MLNTIGYEGAELDDFVSTLKLAGITCLVDIRERAQSRRKGFSKTALADCLGSNGINYVHFRDLGDPAEGRQAARSGNYTEFRRIFSGVMRTKAAQDALDAVEFLMEQQVICLLCFERDPQQCHRKMVADALESRSGRKVRHLGVRSGVSSLS